MNEKPPLHCDLLQRDPHSNFDNQGAVLLIQSKDAEIKRLKAENEQLRGLLHETARSVWILLDEHLLSRIDAALRREGT